MFRFEESYQAGPNKHLCEGWCCGYAPPPRDPKAPVELLSEEEQARIDKLKKTRSYSKCYFESLDDIFNALDFELWYSIHQCKVRERHGQFSFNGQTYTYARKFDFEIGKAWIEIKDETGHILYGKSDDDLDEFEKCCDAIVDQLDDNPQQPQNRYGIPATS